MPISITCNSMAFVREIRQICYTVGVWVEVNTRDLLNLREPTKYQTIIMKLHFFLSWLLFLLLPVLPYYCLIFSLFSQVWQEYLLLTYRSSFLFVKALSNISYEFYWILRYRNRFFFIDLCRSLTNSLLIIYLVTKVTH